jgi:hypothetical protein
VIGRDDEPVLDSALDRNCHLNLSSDSNQRQAA